MKMKDDIFFWHMKMPSMDDFFSIQGWDFSIQGWKTFIFDDRGQSKKIPHIPFVSVFFRVLPFLHHYFSHPQNQPNLAIHYNNYRCCKILCSILANRKKETIKQEITKTKFGLETNKDEMYYSVFENGSRNSFLSDFQRLRMRKRKSLLLYQIQIKRLSTIWIQMTTTQSSAPHNPQTVFSRDFTLLVRLLLRSPSGGEPHTQQMSPRFRLHKRSPWL